MTTRVAPFSCGSDYIGWQERNCMQCRRFALDDAGYPVFQPDGSAGCDLELALGVACIGDGLVEQSVMDRTGLPAGECREKDPRPRN